MAGEGDISSRTCRICLGDGTTADLGRLFSPCKCKGSMKFVHVDCLNSWRKMSAKQETYYQCDLCKYKYSFARPYWATLLTKKWILFLATLVVMTLMVFVLGFVSKLLYVESVSEFFSIDLLHFTSGAMVVGFGGFINLFFFYGIHLQWIGDAARGTRSNSNDWAFVIGVVVVVGLIRAMYKLFQLIEDYTQKQLVLLSESILDVK